MCGAHLRDVGAILAIIVTQIYIYIYIYIYIHYLFICLFTYSFIRFYVFVCAFSDGQGLQGLPLRGSRFKHLSCVSLWPALGPASRGKCYKEYEFAVLGLRWGVCGEGWGGGGLRYICLRDALGLGRI